MDIHLLQQELDLVIQHAPAINRAYAEAKGNYDRLNNFHKAELARLTNLAEGKSVAEKTNNALGSVDYHTFLEGLDEANKAYLLAFGKKNSLETKLSALQSLSKLYQREYNQ